MDGFAEAASSSFQSLVQQVLGLKYINLIVVYECFEVLAVFA
jgi:hypothetical protein